MLVNAAPSGGRAIACLLLTLAASAQAALKTDPFAYDPSFNGGVVIEDRFAATSLNTSDLGLRAVIGADGGVASPPGNFGLVRYSAAGERLV